MPVCYEIGLVLGTHTRCSLVGTTELDTSFVTIIATMDTDFTNLDSKAANREDNLTFTTVL